MAASGRRKITVVGGGNVGATLVQRLAERDYADVVMVDIVEGMPQGKALDLNQCGPILGHEATIVGTNGYEETAGSDVVVITSGFPRQPGMSRDDLLLKNREIVGGVAEQVRDSSPDAIVVVVANPLDAMCHVAMEVTGFPRERVVGMAGILDSARFRTFIAWEAGVSTKDVTGFVMGGHGDTMVPVVSNTTIAGIPVTHLIAQDKLDAIVKRTAGGGGEIVKLLGRGSAYYAPSAATAEMVDAIILDKKRLVPCAAYLQGEYGINDLFVGVPVVLGRGGVEKIVEVELTDAEREALHKSAGAVQELVDVMANAGA